MPYSRETPRVYGRMVNNNIVLAQASHRHLTTTQWEGLLDVSWVADGRVCHDSNQPIWISDKCRLAGRL